MSVERMALCRGCAQRVCIGMRNCSRPVLDKGFVRLVDSMGDDNAIVQAARVSYGTGTKGIEADTKLIHYLMAHNHTSPFEQVVLKFHIKLPIFVMRQLVRHRTARINEVSARYTEVKDEFYIPSVDRIQGQSTTNKQGSEGILTEQVRQDALSAISVCSEGCFFVYDHLLKQGVARETARLVLPVNTYTEVYFQLDLHNLFHLLRLRDDPHSQWETQQYARAMGAAAQAVAPVAYAAYLKTREVK
jgi:thymidylate synthase (FAD)